MLRVKVRVERDYVAPADYSRLLKRYSFRGRADTDILARFLDDSMKGTDPAVANPAVLELGCGTGRATVVMLEKLRPKSLHLLDLSGRMIAHARRRLAGVPGLHFLRSDAVGYLETCRRRYDLIYSLWSFSHSVHQRLGDYGFLSDMFRVQRAVRRMAESMLNPGGRFFLIHVDSRSDEQRILFRQWARRYPLFRDLENQTPSKLLLDDILRRLAQEGRIRDLTIRHHAGDPIRYESMAEALDVFLNFHLESAFNGTDVIPEVVKSIERGLRPHQDAGGGLRVSPGCFVFSFRRV